MNRVMQMIQGYYHESRAHRPGPIVNLRQWVHAITLFTVPHRSYQITTVPGSGNNTIQTGRDHFSANSPSVAL
jgi:hypothetical protein